MKATAFATVPGRTVEQLGHDPDPAEPVRPGPIDGLLDLDVVRGRRGGRPRRRTAGRPGVRAPRNSRIVADRVASGQAGVDERSERREPDPAGDDDDVAAGRLARPASHGRAGRAGRASSPRSRPVRARVAGPAARMVRSRPSRRNREIEIGRREKAGRAAITNWPGRPASRRRSRRSQVERDGVGGLAGRAVDVDGHEAAEGRGRRGPGDCGSRVPVPAPRSGQRDRRAADAARAGDLRHRHRSDAGDDRQLLADVDADRAPGDAPPAADAAARAELVPPGRELVGQPLAVAILAVRPERATRDLREPVGEAANPRSVPRSRSSRRDRTAGRRSCRSRSGRRGCSSCSPDSVRRRPPSPGWSGRGRRGPLGRSTCPTGSPIARRAPATTSAAASRADGSATGRSSDATNAAPGRRSGPDDVALVELGQRNVETRGHLGPRAHGRAEAGRGRCRAFDGDDEGRGPAGAIVAVDRLAVEQDAILDAEGGQLAGPHAEEREGGRMSFRTGESDTRRCPLADADGCTRRERPALRGHRPDGVVEPPGVLAARRAGSVPGAASAPLPAGRSSALVISSRMMASSRTTGPMIVRPSARSASRRRSRSSNGSHGSGPAGRPRCVGITMAPGPFW